MSRAKQTDHDDGQRRAHFLPMTLGGISRQRYPGRSGGSTRGPSWTAQEIRCIPTSSCWSRGPAVWLPRFFQPLRQNHISNLIRHLSPTDLFTIFDWWPLDGLKNSIARGSSVADGIVLGKAVHRGRLLTSGYLYLFTNTISRPTRGGEECSTEGIFKVADDSPKCRLVFS